MSKEIKNKILLAASKKGSAEQRINYDLLPFVDEIYQDGYINTLELNEGSTKYIQVVLNTNGEKFLNEGGYK